MSPESRSNGEAAVPLSIREMAATLAHEVKNPLSLVRANINLLELDDESASRRASYSLIKRELDKINDLVMDMINLTLAPARFEAVGLRELVGSAASPFIETYSPGIIFNLALPESELYISGNPYHLKLVLSNLIKNAVEAVEAAAPELGGNIAISLSSSRCAALITIRDNGTGLPPEAGGALTDSRFTTKRGGSGLGLYASRIIISQHGGELSIADGPGGGCVCSVSIPAVVK
jgi:two-component system, sporulation sensor kinase E